MAQAKWLQKTAEEVKHFEADEALCDVSCLKLRVCEHGWRVSSWVRAALEEENYAEEAQEITGILESQKVKGSALLELTADDLRNMNILVGPGKVLAKRIAALSAPPTAASGFQAGASADWKGAWASLWKFVRTTRAPRSSSRSWPTLNRRTWVKAAWGLGVGDLFCLRRCCRCAGLQPHEVPARGALQRERAKINTTRRAWNATFELMRNGTKRVAMLGVPGIGKSRNLARCLWHLVTDQLPDGIPQPEAIVYEAREGGAVFLFTKGQGGEWKAQCQQIEDWRASGCVYLKNTSNWYLVDASDKRKTASKLAAKTVVACSPDPEHYSNFVKDGECVFVEAFRWAEVEVCYPELKTQVHQEDLRQRFQQVGGALRTLLASVEGYRRAVQLQRAEAKDFTTVERAFAGDLSTFAEKKMPTRLFTYLSADGISNSVTVCSPGAPCLSMSTMTSSWRCGALQVSQGMRLRSV